MLDKHPRSHNNKERIESRGRNQNMKLIIVESPHKSKTIGQFLGKDYKVVASKGHIRDLASSGHRGLGVDVEHDFKPTYVIPSDKRATVKELKEDVKKADDVYLATDPDREGEAISWHLAQVLGLDVQTTKRLEFHEITKPAILRALENPRTIDRPLVESQETRRIIDRIMGFRLSYLLQKKIKSPSGGRVQSVVLKFVVDREKEIKDFVPQEYWTISGTFKDKNDAEVVANLATYQGKPLSIKNEEEVKKILANLPKDYTATSLKTSNVKKDPRPPFITSTRQQEAFARYHFSANHTQSIAQHLYEGVEIKGQATGLITYMRTDSIRLADEFIQAAHDRIEKNYGKEYLGRVHVQKSSKNVQDAHEAIRPTDLSLTPGQRHAYLTEDEYKLYLRIYNRAVASLRAPKVDALTTLVLEGDGYGFNCSNTKTLFDGYTRIYNEETEEEKKKESKIPNSIKEGDLFTSVKMDKEQHFTKAPSRYNEGKIVKLRQENGIGRPSTYAKTISTLIEREYVKSVKGSLIPTEQGDITVDALVHNFPKYRDVSYTANRETSLDNIADGKTDRLKLLSDFWSEFTKYFDAAKQNREKLQPKVVEGRVCPKCGSPLVYRKGKYGEFIGCSNYPSCTYIEKEEPKVVEGRVCPKCGKPLIYRKGRYGKFIGCSGYPECDYREDSKGRVVEKGAKKPVEIPADAPLCPRCHKGHLIEKKSRWGKTFIGCSNYPKCRYIVPSKDQKDKKEEK